MVKVFKQFLIIVIFAFCIYLYYEIQSLPINQKQIELKSCVDGDTAVFVIENEEKTFRFLAIDAPELETELGKEVSNYVCNTFKNASKITIEYEQGVSVDKYNRELAWIYVDDKLLQEDLIEKGYAQVKYIYGDYKYVDRLEKLQEKAKEKQLGIWK